MIPLIAALAVTLCVALWRRAARGAQYYCHPFGFVGLGKPESATHVVDREQLSKIVARLAVGDLFDMLQVTRDGDPYGGVMLTRPEEVLELSASFKTHSQQAELSAFREAMSRAGFIGTEESNGFNGGFGEQHRVTDIEFRMPNDVATNLAAIDAALANLQPGTSPLYHVWGGRYVVKGQRGFGFAGDDRGDPIAEIL